MKSDYPPHLQRAIERAESSNGEISPALEVFRARQNAALTIAKGFHPPNIYRSQLERDYAEHLEQRRLAGEILRWIYEPFTLHLGGEAGTRKGVKYKIDWLVLPAGLELECHETKGHWRRGERERLKLAAARYPFVFKAVTRDDTGAWCEERF